MTLPRKVVAPGTPGSVEVPPDDGTQGENATKVRVVLRADNPEATIEVLDREGEDALSRSFRAEGSTSPTGPDPTQHGEWRHVCVSPCDQVVDVRRDYRVAGEGVVPSTAFKLQTTPDGRIGLSAKTAGTGRRSAGYALIAIGALGTAGGIGLLVAGEITKNHADATPSRTTAFRAAGGAALGAGVVLLASGIAVAVLAKTHVKLETGVQIARTPLYLSLSGLHF